MVSDFQEGQPATDRVFGESDLAHPCGGSIPLDRDEFERATEKVCAKPAAVSSGNDPVVQAFRARVAEPGYQLPLDPDRRQDVLHVFQGGEGVARNRAEESRRQFENASTGRLRGNRSGSEDSGHRHLSGNRGWNHQGLIAAKELLRCR